MPTAQNDLIDVATYNNAAMPLMLNSCVALNVANMKYDQFNTEVPQNLGSSVDFDLPPRMTASSGLVINLQAGAQRKHRLTVDQSEHVAYDFTAEQLIFNADGYLDKFGRSAVAELAAKIDANILSIIPSSTYRFFGDGKTPLSSFLQVANMITRYRNYGAPKIDTKVVLPDTAYPAIINSGLNQFVPKRNEKQAMSWEMGSFMQTDFYSSNLLPVHEAGTAGNDNVTLTVTGVTKVNNAVTEITFSSAMGAAPEAIKANDKLYFQDPASGTKLRYLTFVGHEVSENPVQFRATEDAAAVAGAVTVKCDPPLRAATGKERNINAEVAVGMTVKVLPTHKCGLIMAGRPLYVAMPRLPKESPFETSSIQDPDTGISLRQYYGSKFGENTHAYVHDAAWGRTLVPEYSMEVALPA
jgi:hypothetical protein